MRTTAELREGFLSFFEERGHVRRPSASVIPPADDPTTLFIVAGMQPMKRWFLGLEQAAAPRVTTVQKAVRAGGKQNDLDDVGLTNRHLCFLEMLGNFSFGDYFKDGAVDFAWEFVTEQMGLDPSKLWATVFAGDPELGLGEDEAALRSWARFLPRYRVVVEHARAAAFLVAEGVVPSNEARGYVLRRIIRRAVRYGRQLGLPHEFMWQLAAMVREQMGSIYPELERNQGLVQEYISGE